MSILVACEAEETAPPAAPDAPDPPAPTRDAENEAAFPAQGPGLDLLRRTPARIFVSSTVDNTTDAPEHLADGRAETA